MIDLHLHTTASDGTLAPDALVAAAAAAGLATLAVTDHDTVAAWVPVEAACRRHGIATLPGIEITAVIGARDVHVLGYAFNPASPELAAFLAAQRADRRRRVVEMAARLDRLGAPVDPDAVSAVLDLPDGAALGRPWLARALVEAGHAADVGDAFDRYLGEGRPAYVARTGAAPEEVVALIHRAGGVASLAHPGLAGLDDRLPALAAAGLDALEAYHPDHDAPTTARYLAAATDLGLLVTGGSDFHGPASGARAAAPGAVTLPEDAFRRLLARAGRNGGRP